VVGVHSFMVDVSNNIACAGMYATAAICCAFSVYVLCYATIVNWCQIINDLHVWVFQNMSGTR
jgi:hypothetical protein